MTIHTYMYICGTYSPVALVVFVVQTITYICDSMSKRCCRKGIVSSTYMSFIGVRLSMKGRICFIGCGTYFIEDNTKRFNVVTWS